MIEFYPFILEGGVFIFVFVFKRVSLQRFWYVCKRLIMIREATFNCTNFVSFICLSIVSRIKEKSLKTNF